MEKKYFLLEVKDNSRVAKIFQLVLGILCIIIAVFWIFFNFKSLKTDSTLWITIVFLLGFGVFEILAGLGKTIKYIEVSADRINLKQNAVLPQLELKPSDLEKIDIFPLSIVFSGKKRNRHILRFGVTNTEVIEPVKDAVTGFAELNNIPVEIKIEEI